jgi:hypothetical protein
MKKIEIIHPINIGVCFLTNQGEKSIIMESFIHYNKSLMRKIIGIGVMLGALYMSINAGKAIELNFSDINASGIQDKFSEIHFNAGGNDFG